jgi:glycosyltransferase involved in cell wall biosynthesis
MPTAPANSVRPSIRIAYITKLALPSIDAATVQIVQTASALARAGARLELFFPLSPGATNGSESALRDQLRRQYQTDCGFELRPLANGWSLSYPFRAGRAATRDFRTDLIHTRDVPNLLLGLASGRRVSFESYRTPDGRTRVVQSLIRRAFDNPRFLGQVTHSRYAMERYLAAGYPAEKLRTIYNGFDPAAFAVDRTPEAARRALGLPERVTVGYAGRLAAFKRIDLLLDAAEAVPELSWVFTGATDPRDARELVERGGELPNVRFLGYRAGEELALAHQAADILVIPPSADPLERFGTTVLPLKLFQYLAAGRPLVVGDVADTAELLRDGETCLRVPPDDLPSFIRGVRALAGDPGRRARMGAAARALAQGLTWDARAAAFLTFLSERLAVG